MRLDTDSPPRSRLHDAQDSRLWSLRQQSWISKAHQESTWQHVAPAAPSANVTDPAEQPARGSYQAYSKMALLPHLRKLGPRDMCAKIVPAMRVKEDDIEVSLIQSLWRWRRHGRGASVSYQLHAACKHLRIPKGTKCCPETLEKVHRGSLQVGPSHASGLDELMQRGTAMQMRMQQLRQWHPPVCPAEPDRLQTWTRRTL